MNELIEKAKDGDIYAFTELVKEFQSDLYHIARTRLSNDDDINDAIQDTMINVFKHLKKLKNTEYFKTWMIKILINECNKIYKRNSKPFGFFNKVELDSAVAYTSSDYIQNVDDSIQFEEMIDKLSYEEKIVLTLYYKDNYSCNEIANILNISVNTVKSRITRSKDKIKQTLKGGAYND